MTTYTNRRPVTTEQRAWMDLLSKAADQLESRQESQDEALRKLHALIASAIETQAADTASLAKAAGVERNYIDQVRISSGLPKLREMANYGRPVTFTEKMSVLDGVSEAATNHAAAVDLVKEAMSVRNGLIVEIYRSDALGPSRIAEAARVDRNHIMRINRSAPGWTPRPRSKFGAKAAKRSVSRRAAAEPVAEKPVIVTVPSTNPFSG